MGKNIELKALSPESEYDPDFLQGMLDRMTVSFFKYGAVADAYPHKVSAMSSMAQRIDRYAVDGNTKWLIDAANFLMIEFMHPSHPDAHYAGTDSDASPGRTKNDGLVVMRQRNETMMEVSE